MTEALTIPHLAAAAARAWPDDEAVVDGAARVSYAQLAARMMDAAAAFVAAGIKPGDRVAIWLPNGLEWIVACLGLQAAGGVLVPLNTRFKGEEVEFIVNRAGVSMVVLPDAFLDVDYQGLLAGRELASLRRVIRVGAEGPDGWAAFLDRPSTADRDEAAARLDALTPDDVSDIMFTSGTTGDPKGAVSTHRQVVWTARRWILTAELVHGDRFLLLWPFFHSAGYKMGWVVCLASGVVALPESTFDPAALVAKVEREAVTFLPGPPTLFQTLLTMPESEHRKLGSVRLAMTGGTTIPPEMVAAIQARLGIKTVITGYGLTESQGVATLTRPGDSAERVALTSGRAVDGVEVRCIAPDGGPAPAGDAGEIVVRGPHVMQGYLDDPRATEEAVDPDGWLLTGDIGSLDEDGYLTIVGRKKEVFITGGFNCYPAEIEKILLQHPDILQAAVVGVPDQRLGEVGLAYVVLAPGAALTGEAVIVWARERMANFKAPRFVRIVDALPLNSMGKVQKFLLSREPG